MTLADTKSNQRQFQERVVEEILKVHHEGTLQPAGDLKTERKLAVLERRAPSIVAAAERAGAEIEYLGVAPLFDETRLYGGTGTDWVLAPVTDKEDAVVPRKERHTLEHLAHGRVPIRLIYIAHEVERKPTPTLPALPPGGHAVIDKQVGKELVGPIPAPHDAVHLADRLNHNSQKALAAAARTGKAVGAAAAVAAMAPVVLVGGALASLATLDPIILGAVPAGAPKVGEPAAWFVLARWDW